MRQWLGVITMNIVITTFTSPFSFFCMLAEDGKDIDFIENCVQTPNLSSNKFQISDVTHGQYVAVMWKNKWVRGLVTMEAHFLIWLIDYGFYLRPNEKTVYINLPPTYKKLPTKVFEASIHGVVPLDKELSIEFELKNTITTAWNTGAIQKAQSLIASASKLYFVPIAIMSTKDNDIILGDLHLDLKQQKAVNIVEELKVWPVFLENNVPEYIKNLGNYYNSRRKHRACLLKPAIADSEIPTMTLNTTVEEYSAICAAASHFEALECGDDFAEGSTVLGYEVRNQDVYKLSAAEIELYSNKYITIGDREHNVLNLLLNKIKDLNMCEKYKDHDLKSVGRASYRNAHSPKSPLLSSDYNFEEFF